MSDELFISTPLRLLQIIRGMDIGNHDGGAERFTIDLSLSLTKSFHIEICLAVLRITNSTAEYQLASDLIDQGIKVIFLNSENKLTSIKSLRDIIVRWHPDIISTQGPICELVTVFATLGFHSTTRLIRTRHVIREMTRKGLKGILYEQVSPPLFHASIGISPDIVEELQKPLLARVLRKKTFYIPNAIDYNRFSYNDPDSPSSMTSTIGHPTIITIGRLEKQKNLDCLLRAMQRVMTVFPTASLVIVGGGTQYHTLNELSFTLGISNNVHFLGPQKQVENFLQKSDLFVSSSSFEGLPSAILEAMAMGIPVVATDISGTNQIVINNRSGILAEVNDSMSLSDAIIYALRNPSDMASMAYTARKMVEQQFTFASIANLYIKIYKQVYESL